MDRFITEKKLIERGFIKKHYVGNGDKTNFFYEFSYVVSSYENAYMRIFKKEGLQYDIYLANESHLFTGILIGKTKEIINVDALLDLIKTIIDKQYE